MTEAERTLARPWLTGPQGIDLVLALEYARAAAGAGETAKARATYEQLLELWREADANFPLLRQVRAELAALGS